VAITNREKEGRRKKIEKIRVSRKKKERKKKKRSRDYLGNGREITL